MSSINVDDILNKLSTKFNKIFYDREFVCCVNQDFEVVLQNKNSCCVVVFPVLGPNYLKAVRYQARIFDLAVITLGTGRNRAIAVCQKEFLKKNSNEVVEVETTNVQIMPQSSVEPSSTKLRKKRPERQLYVPPAQRRLPLTTDDQNVKNEEAIRTKTAVRNTPKEHEKNHSKPRSKQNGVDPKTKRESKGESPELTTEKCRAIESESDERICLDYLFSLHYVYTLWHYKVSESDPLGGQGFFSIVKSFHKLPIYRARSHLNSLYILHKNLVLWQPKLSVRFKCDTVSSDTSRTYPLYDFETTLTPNDCVLQKKTSVSDYRSESLGVYENVSRNFDYLEFTAFKISWNKNECVSESDVIVDLSIVNCGHNFVINCRNGGDYFWDCPEDHEVFKCYLEKRKEICSRKDHCKKDTNSSLDQKQTPLVKSSVIALDDKTSVNKTEDKSILTVKQNNDKNTSTNTTLPRNLIKNVTNEIIKTPKKSNEHEQEKEIMRKTKEHINRKSRPIIKYVDDNDMLNIGKNDDVNNWEELFDDEGQLQEEYFKEVVDKVGREVTIVKAKEDYSDYVSKQSEDLEHMVELYDFPPTLETHDIIQAFSVIDSEAMYVKWVDDTHAILVLGSLTQAQRAIELDNPLIKARPMTAASSSTLATAYKHDLKPAMKRPQTNLQTARRLITTYLGTKSKISKEQNAKERNDLKAARELKKLAKKNEQDAWEGNLRSAIN